MPQFLKGMAAKRVLVKIKKIKNPSQSQSKMLKIPKFSSSNLRFRLGGVKRVSVPKVRSKKII
jgi:hypothetical protein